jgi:hypothetical protein
MSADCLRPARGRLRIAALLLMTSAALAGCLGCGKEVDTPCDRAIVEGKPYRFRIESVDSSAPEPFSPCPDGFDFAIGDSFVFTPQDLGPPGILPDCSSWNGVVSDFGKVRFTPATETDTFADGAAMVAVSSALIGDACRGVWILSIWGHNPVISAEPPAFDREFDVEWGSERACGLPIGSERCDNGGRVTVVP